VADAPLRTDLRTTGFQSARECTDELERWVSHQPMTFEGRKNAGRQVQCDRCFRWKYADERCNLFVHSGKTGVIE
jgi:hypothetical protein